MDVYTWGLGEHLGVPCDKESVVALPVRVPLGKVGIVQVACGDNFTIALTTTGRVLSWGSNPSARLGHDGPDGAILPVTGLEGVTHIAAGQSHCLCVMTDAQKQHSVVAGWGSGHHCALAVDAASTKTVISQPVVLPYFEDAMFVAAGYANSACITLSGDLYVWGDNRFGKCCGVVDGTEMPPVVITTPLKLVFSPSPVTFCALGSSYSAAIDADGKVYTWGYGIAGNLGHGDRRSVPFPKMVESLSHLRVTHVACTVGQISPMIAPPEKVCGKENPHTFFVDDAGSLYACGTCHKGMLGNFTKKILSPPDGDELVPYHVGSPTRDVPNQPSRYLEGEICTMAISASIHSCVITRRGAAFSFGCGSDGRMGIEKFLYGLHGGRSRMKCYVSEPTPIEVFEREKKTVVSISSSRRHMAALVERKSVVPTTSTEADADV